MSSASSPAAAVPQSPETSKEEKVHDGEISKTITDEASLSPGEKSSPPSEGEIEESSQPDEQQKGEETQSAQEAQNGPPLPNEPIPDGPPLPNEPVPETQDDGWECLWDAGAQAWYFANRITGVTQWENPRVPSATVAAPQPPVNERPAAGGYNPAIHGDYDPNAWYAQAYNQEQEQQEAAAAGAMADPMAAYEATAAFNRFTGQFQQPDAGPSRHSDEAKSRRQMNAYFDVDAAANAHEGRSLKAERQNQRLSKAELKAYKEKRRAKKEEKRRAWLMD